MTGYLQRLVDAQSPGAVPPLAPVVRSESPTFAQDQLLGFGDIADDVAGPSDGDSPAAAPDRPMPSPRAVEAIPLAAPPAPTRREMAEPAPPAAHSPEIPTPAESPAGKTPPVMPQVTTVVRVTETEATEPHEKPGDGDSGHERPVADRPDMDRPPEPVTARPPPRPEPAAMAHEGEPANQPARQPADAPSPAPIEMVPRPRPDPEPPVSQPQSPAAHDVGQAPPITIGQVTVTVLPDEPPEQAAAPRPMTAAAASRIGPLGDLRAVQRLYALRR